MTSKQVGSAWKAVIQILFVVATAADVFLFFFFPRANKSPLTADTTTATLTGYRWHVGEWFADCFDGDIRARSHQMKAGLQKDADEGANL